MSASHRALWRGLLTVLGTGREIRWLAVVEPYKAYLDETNIHDNAQWCFVAGHLGREEQWEEYDLKWREGLGRRKSLHMKELRWNSKPRRIERLLARLGPIPDSCKLERIFGSVKGSHYTDIVSGYPAWARLHSDPFVMALWPCVIQTLRHLPRTERIIFAFEQNDSYLPVLQFMERSMKGNPIFTTPTGEHRAIFVPVPKGSSPRTEAADYLAFEMGQLRADQNSFKARAGISIVGDWWMIGQEIKRKEIRGIVTTSILIAEQKTRMDIALRNFTKLGGK